MSTVAVKVKDFVIDIEQVKEKVKAKKQVQKKKVEHKYNVVLQNNTDFVLQRTTSTTDRSLVFLISQAQFYLKDNKSGDVDPLSETRLRAFFQNVYHNRFELLDKVEWWAGTPEQHIEKMMLIVRNPDYQNMYRHGVFVDKWNFDRLKAEFNQNPKLFRYCNEKVKQSVNNRDCFNNILKFASLIEEKINYNNATYFIDTICESNVKFMLDSYYHERMLNLVSMYNLNFNRFIQYICQDLYSQGKSSIEGRLYATYNDYLNMQNVLFGEIKDKYPKYLETEHDIIALKYNLYKTHKESLALIKIGNTYKHLEYKSGQYEIILPKTTAEIVNEGINLSHCVASYAEKVALNQTLILFMRYKDTPSDSLITIQVNEGNNVVQARGFANRKPDKTEADFLKKWIKAKKLETKIEDLKEKESIAIQ